MTSAFTSESFLQNLPLTESAESLISFPLDKTAHLHWQMFFIQIVLQPFLSAPTGNPFYPSTVLCKRSCTRFWQCKDLWKSMIAPFIPFDNECSEHRTDSATMIICCFNTWESNSKMIPMDTVAALKSPFRDLVLIRTKWSRKTLNKGWYPKIDYIDKNDDWIPPAKMSANQLIWLIW